MMLRSITDRFYHMQLAHKYMRVSTESLISKADVYSFFCVKQVTRGVEAPQICFVEILDLTAGLSL